MERLDQIEAKIRDCQERAEPIVLSPMEAHWLLTNTREMEAQVLALSQGITDLRDARQRQQLLIEHMEAERLPDPSYEGALRLAQERAEEIRRLEAHLDEHDRCQQETEGRAALKQQELREEIAHLKAQIELLEQDRPAGGAYEKAMGLVRSMRDEIVRLREEHEAAYIKIGQLKQELSGRVELHREIERLQRELDEAHETINRLRDKMRAVLVEEES